MVFSVFPEKRKVNIWSYPAFLVKWLTWDRKNGSKKIRYFRCIKIQNNTSNLLYYYTLCIVKCKNCTSLFISRRLIRKRTFLVLYQKIKNSIKNKVFNYRIYFVSKGHGGSENNKSQDNSKRLSDLEVTKRTNQTNYLSFLLRCCLILPK